MSGNGTLAAQDGAFGHFRGRAEEVPVEPLLRMQGYRDPARVRPRVRDIATKAAASARSLIAPEACYRRVPIESCGPEELRLAGGVVRTSRGWLGHGLVVLQAQVWERRGRSCFGEPGA